jgi:predicted phage terminase large subunit-like protein
MNLSLEEFDLICRNDFMTFLGRSFSELLPQTLFIPGQFIEVMAARLEACERGECRRLIISLPPRSLKSLAASVAFPAWILGRNPSAQIICASYGQQLSDKNARDCRTLMNSPFFKKVFPATRLASEKRSVNEFITTLQGVRLATSVGGPLTGRGAGFLIVDDPLKPVDALSDVARPAVNEWYDNSLLSRLNDKRTDVIIIIMQRLHLDDLIGHVLQQEEWEVLSFPAIAEDDEVYSYKNLFGERKYVRKRGEVLHPEREPLDLLLSLRASMGSYNFSAQYQQQPQPFGGNVILREWLKFYSSETLPKRFTSKLQSWDTANKSHELNDYSVCTTWGFRDSKYYLIDVYRKRLTFPELKRALVEQKAKHSANIVLVEDKGSGTQLIQEMQHSSIRGVRAYETPSQMDKKMRLFNQSDKFEGGQVFLPTSAPWLDEYINELLSFPGCVHDDQVDSTTQALDYLGSKVRDLDVWRRI